MSKFSNSSCNRVTDGDLRGYGPHRCPATAVVLLKLLPRVSRPIVGICSGPFLICDWIQLKRISGEYLACLELSIKVNSIVYARMYSERIWCAAS